jgi:hypothetical protein
MAKKKLQKHNVMFMGHLSDDAKFLYSFYQYTQKNYQKDYNVFYDRISSFLLMEFLFAFTVRLPKEIIDEIAEYNYKLYISKYKNRFFTKFLFHWLAKAYFVKYYGKLLKKKIEYLFIYDDNEIKKKACVIAARVLKVNYTILYQGYKPNVLLMDHFATRWRSLMPHNPEFYLQISGKRKTTPSQKDNIVLVVLQDDKSVESVLYAPVISKQFELLQLITDVSQVLIKTRFVIFNASKWNAGTHNIVYTKENFASFLPKAKAVVTINCQSAMHALDFDIPIIAFGDAVYNIEGVSVVPKSKKEFIDILEKPSVYYNKSVACNFMNVIDGKTAVTSSMSNPSTQTFETILHM